MQLIKLDATASTNVYLKSLAQERTLEDYTTVLAHEQLNGKGQMGATWHSEKGKNLTFSVLKHQKDFLVQDQFRLTMMVSLALFDALQSLQIPDLQIKWPNDILSGKNKISGILIENILSGHCIKTSVIGIGLNVNQTQFGDLPQVSSLKIIKKKTYNLEEVLDVIITKLKYNFIAHAHQNFSDLKKAYLKVLFRKDKPSTFKNLTNSQLFTGIIRGVSEEGKLLVEVEDFVMKAYDLKEIRLLY